MGSASKGNRKIRYAVIGQGYISQAAVLPAFEHAAENSELVALFSEDPEKLKTLGEKYHVRYTGNYAEYDHLLASGRVDAVYIALPNNLHREYTERAARAGVHVLCEKPMAVTEEDCEAMIRATREAGVKLMTAYRLHFEEANLKAIECVRSGKLGEARFFDSVFSQQVKEGDFRLQQHLGGGTLYDIGVYCINAARCIFQDEPTQAIATVAKCDERRFREVPEMTSAILRFPGERLATFTCSFGAASVSSYRVVGTKGELRLEPAYELADELVQYLTVNGKTKEHKYRKRDQFAPELLYFSRCILEHLEPEPSGIEGLADVRVIRALLRSAESGQPVQLDKFEKRDRPDLSLKIKCPPVKMPKLIHASPPSGK
jgi:glucose-fructose oxidoreductase